MIRQDLIKILELTSRALADNDSIPIFRCFCFHGSTISTYNGTLGIIAGCTTDDVFGVNGPTFLGLLKNSRVNELDIKLEAQEVVVKAGRSTFRLPFFPEDEFLLEKPTEKAELTIKITEPFVAGMNACLATVSRDDTQRALFGVCVNATQKQIVLYSTDGDALSACTLVGTKGNGKQYTVPTQFCETVLKIWAETEAKTATIDLSGGWAIASLSSGYTIFSSLLQIDNPVDHKAEIANTLKGPVKYLPIPKGFEHALARARVLAEPETKPTSLKVEKGRLKLLTETHMGIVRDSIAFEGHPDVEAQINSVMAHKAISMSNGMAIRDNCMAFVFGDAYQLLVSNMSK